VKCFVQAAIDGVVAEPCRAVCVLQAANNTHCLAFYFRTFYLAPNRDSFGTQDGACGFEMSNHE
jgi:hypothetical protein